MRGEWRHSSSHLLPISSSSSSSSSSMGASYSPFCLLIFCASLLFSLSEAKTLVIPVVKDALTLQYLTSVSHSTPLVTSKLVVDLGGRYVPIQCEQGYVSSSYRPVRCGTAKCSLAKPSDCSNACYTPPSPVCLNNSCHHDARNTIGQFWTRGEVTQDVLALQSTLGPKLTVPRFLFSCTPIFYTDGLGGRADGMAGFGRAPLALPSQLAAVLRVNNKFALCLSSSTSASGGIFFGEGPYLLLPNIDVSKSLTYTPLIRNPIGLKSSVLPLIDLSAEYFIGVRSIKVNDKRLSINSSLLSIDNKNGDGGTKISTITPYTTLESTIYRALTEAFIKWAKANGIARGPAVAPFDLCFNSKKIVSTRVGPGVPTVDLVLQSEDVRWRIFGSNSMISVKGGALCLAFLDGGLNPTTSIVIGGYQLENNLVEFDLGKKRLGFSSTLLSRQTTCQLELQM